MIVFGPNQCQVRGCPERGREYDVTAQGLRLMGVRLCEKHAAESAQDWQRFAREIVEAAS